MDKYSQSKPANVVYTRGVVKHVPEITPCLFIREILNGAFYGGWWVLVDYCIRCRGDSFDGGFGGRGC